MRQILFKALKTTVLYVILMSRDGFKCDPETKLQTSTS